MAALLTGHAPPEQPPRPVLRFASIQAAASWGLGWRDHEAAWSRRPSRWRHARHVAAAQAATRVLPEECRRRVGGRPGAPAATAAGRHRRGWKDATPSWVDPRHASGLAPGRTWAGRSPPTRASGRLRSHRRCSPWGRLPRGATREGEGRDRRRTCCGRRTASGRGWRGPCAACTGRPRPGSSRAPRRW